MGVIARVKQALNASSRMWKTFSLLFLAATIGWSHKAGDLMLVDEAVKLLQIDNVQSLEKNLLNVKAEKAEKEQEVEALKAELELAKKQPRCPDGRDEVKPCRGAREAEEHIA